MTSNTIDTITVQVRFFARLREELGVETEPVDLAAGGTVADLIGALAAREGAWRQLRDGRPVMTAVNQIMARPQQPLRDGDEVALFPPVTGG
ncbi:MAG: molybdopterin converting factor subunit 1 [Marinobacter sp.]|uniref:molybdopterin converting factor subunit 1 n=1 Tax=Marinobacter sp. TaxID=50741 RepID=UPI00299ED214|nr:molybdopterin converting factor subunit 1 [Marinobacter sp.]MDX1633212.1 molybdopterin converting factor subunit 1 [Marinobacter sp.]